MQRNAVLRVNIDLLPQKSGVYFFLNKRGEIFYIGKSNNIKKRVQSHLRPAPPKWGGTQAKAFHPADFARETAKVSWIETANETEALIKEAECIKQYLPKYNILLKDGKNYFYVAISRSLASLPFISLTHQPAREKEFGYIGPFTDGRLLKKLLRYLRKPFPYYTAKKHSRLPCQYCHLGLCPGPNPDPRAYKKTIQTLKKILLGGLPSVRKQLTKEVKTAAKEMRFEDAQYFKEISDSLGDIFARKDSLANAPLPQQAAAARELARILGIKKSVETIEGYDISNIQGREPTASEVRFSGGKPDKSLYRKFRIRLPETPNDFAMMREVITRRLGHPEWPHPDMFLIDGGKGQLNAANAAMKTYALFHKIPLAQMPRIASIAKRYNELFVLGKDKSLKLDSEVSPAVRNLLMYVRDEAHRFAIAYHRKLHRKTFGK